MQYLLMCVRGVSKEKNQTFHQAYMRPEMCSFVFVSHSSVWLFHQTLAWETLMFDEPWLKSFAVVDRDVQPLFQWD